MLRVVSDTKVPIKIWASNLEAEAEQQVRHVASLPFIAKHVAVMADAHAGKGSTVGTVIATKGAIIPAAVGVDIGCGMKAIKLPYKVDRLGGDERLKILRHSIERSVPTGRNGNAEISKDAGYGMLALGALCAPTEERVLVNAAKQCGSLGGGNHFIEICRDLDDNLWVMLHSGSRNIGKRLADVHINGAKDLMRRYFIDLPDPDLAYLVQGTPEFEMYLNDLMWAQRYAKLNRDLMGIKIMREVYYHLFKDEWATKCLEDTEKLFVVDCHHNYTAIENHFGKNVYVTRKGAVSAKKGEYGIIPGSMGVKSFIVEGLGNPDSFDSCSHGAGRRMSRTKAKQIFTAKDLAEQTAGVECRKDVIDEIPGAYKDIDEVMANQVDLVKPVYELKQLICIKGD